MFLKLLDEKCQYNEYILTFKCTKSSQELSKIITDLKNRNIDNVYILFDCINTMIEELNDYILF